MAPAARPPVGIRIVKTSPFRVPCRFMAGQPGLSNGYLLVSVLTVGPDDAGLFQPDDNRPVR